MVTEGIILLEITIKVIKDVQVPAILIEIDLITIEVMEVNQDLTTEVIHL